MKIDRFTKNVILNCVSVLSCSIAIALACKVTKSAMPLWALLLVPKWDYSENKITRRKNK